MIDLEKYHKSEPGSAVLSFVMKQKQSGQAMNLLAKSGLEWQTGR